MTSTLELPRKLIVLGVVLPLAAIIGYYLATPDSRFTLGFVAMVLGCLTIPMWLRWHHAILVFSWNAAIEFFFLPGSPRLWMIAAIISGGISFLNYILDRDRREHSSVVSSVMAPLLFLGLVVLVTGSARGGFGTRAFGGGTFGGKHYILIFLGILGCFALASQRITPQRAKVFVAIFFLTSLTAVVSNLIYLLGPSFYALYLIFPSSYAVTQALAETSVAGASVMRFTGFMFAGLGLVSYLLARFGIAGIFDMKKPWRLLFLLLVAFAGLLGGFRSTVIMFLILFAVQFVLEGLLKTRLFPVLMLMAVLTAALLIPMADKLPLSIQRSISFLPLQVDPVARMDAQGTSEWRLKMWKLLVPEVPKYLWFGKGCAFSPSDYYLMLEAIRLHAAEDIEASIMTGGYHNGPLTILIPFGIWGAIGFTWFVVAALRLLYRNYRNSPPELRSINTLLLSLFVMKLLYYLTIFGHFVEDIGVFCGIVGLSCSLNGGCRRTAQAEIPLSQNSPELAPVAA